MMCTQSQSYANGRHIKLHSLPQTACVVVGEECGRVTSSGRHPRHYQDVHIFQLIIAIQGNRHMQPHMEPEQMNHYNHRQCMHNSPLKQSGNHKSV